ncbi:39S ribosomal protein L45, mitochondrial [Cichlidogyrus casuarinus]|uniref:Large ribosomal subunit protein mL45 n=1 Tax=Cichlidogyrus casuarinus TaxID=1844966 RepID=A0ABD2QPX0_9PLAT
MERFAKLDPPSPIEFKKTLLKHGLLPPPTLIQAPINLSNSATVFDPFKPKEMDGKGTMLSYLSKEKALDLKKNSDGLLKYVTEMAYGKLLEGLELKTIEWKFLKSLEPANVVQVRAQEIGIKDVWYGQVTVRFHSQQTIAIYDRFGRLTYGNPNIPVDVLEYVVFEKHLTNEYGSWRIHSKIKPGT